MRRKSERVKEKDKSSEKKIDKSPRKSRRSSRRRKKSSSSSEESETDEHDASFKSCKDDVDEDLASSRIVPEKSKTTHMEGESKGLASTTDVEGKDRRHNKKQAEEEIEETPRAAEHAKEMKEENVEGTDTLVENLDKHKESESKSSVWQVKSADCSGGEINKLKLRIVRPPEPVEPEPRKRKKLSRMPHRESDICTGEPDERASQDSQDEKSRSRKSLSSVSDESKSEYRKHEGRTERRPKPDDSSDEEKNVDSTEGAVGTPTNKGNIQEEDQNMKVMRKQGNEDHIEENKVLRIEVGEKEGTIDTTGLSVESSSPVSLYPVDKSKLEKSGTAEYISVKENTKPSNTPEILPEHCPTSPKEIHVCNLDENNAGVSSLLEVQKPIVSTDESQVSGNNALEEDATVPDLPSANGTLEGVSKNQESCLEQDIVVKDSKSKSRDFSKERSKDLDITDNKALIDKSTEKVLTSIPVKKSTSHDSSESEEERVSYRKLQESKKKSHRLMRPTSNPPEKNIGTSLQLKTNTFKAQASEKSCDVENPCKTTNKHVDTSKDSKCKESKGSPRLERKKYKNIESHGSVESIDKPQAKEKVSLKRSFSRVSDNNTSSHVPPKDEDLNKPLLHKKIFEGNNTTLENAPIDSEVQPNITRKRRWGASKSTTTVKKTTLSISSDSLKHLIPEVKPLLISEVQLTEDEDEEEEGEVLDRVEESFEIESEIKTEKHREEVAASNNQTEEKEHLYPLPTVPNPPDSTGKSGTFRKISIVTADAPHLQRSPSPARHRASNILFITNLVRPFTVNQLRELLARTGTIVANGFWIDKIKSKCYVQYETETEARETRHALHGVRWPVSNPKQLSVDYAKKEDMDLARDLAEGNHIPRKTEPLKMERVDGWLAEQGRDKNREQLLRDDRERNRDRDRDRVRVKDRHPIVAMEVVEKTREAKVPISIREWDLGKMDMESFDDRGFHREERSGGERDRRMRKDRNHRSPSRDAPGRKIRKKDEEAPAKLLDDLFKKTKVTPCVYWLPLTADQIVVKEEMRRKHMAEHERRMAEMRKAEKAERDRHRARMQGRTSQRRFDERERDKRRHRSPSSSPKK